MKLSIKQARAIKNAIAAEYDPYFTPYKYVGTKRVPDPRAWEGADIPNRESINRIVSKIKKL